MQNLLHPDDVALEDTNATPDTDEPINSFELTDAAKAAAVMAATIALAACGGGSDSAGTTAKALSDTSGYKYPTPTSDEDAVRFLTQAQFSATDEEVASLRSTGYAAFIMQQSEVPMTSGVSWLDSKTYNSIDNATQYYYQTYPADYMLWNQLLSAPDAMRKRIQLALSEFFVVSMTGIDSIWTNYLIASYWDMLGRNAFGNFRTLLEDVTLHPAMGWYLNTKGNQKEQGLRQPDENYGREVMQLMTIGLYQLNLDGTVKTDSTGAKIDTYTASDVTNIARIFTGYDYNYTTDSDVVPTGGTGTLKTNNFTKLPMRFTPGNHSVLASTFLGVTVPAQSPATAAGGAAKLKTALDTLFNHPNVGPFFGKQMIQRLVTSNPSPAYVARVASVFNNNGSGVRGDLRAVFAAILLDDEARGPAGLSNAYWGKLREPVVRMAQWGRTFGINSARGSWKIGDLSRPNDQLGQSTFRSGSVFNFFRPGYVPPSTALAAVDAPAPEFQIVTETSVGGYLNFMMSIIKDGIFVNTPELPQNVSTSSNGRDITCAYTRELALVADASALVARINKFLCAGQLSAATQATIVNALNATALGASPTLAVKMNRVGAAVLLVMASPEYLVQK